MTFEYAASGRLTSILEENIAEGNTIRHSYTYGPQGLPTLRTVAVLAGTGRPGSTYLHDGDGNISAETSAGNQVDWDYSCFGALRPPSPRIRAR